jgi:hypothetical protein
MLDDIILVPLLISISIKLIPKIVPLDAKKKLDTNPKSFKKNNWLFAFFIILIWFLLVYFVYKVYEKHNI